MPNRRTAIRQWIARALLGETLDTAPRAAAPRAAAPISVRVDDDRGWQMLSGGGPHDRPWSERYQDLEDALDAWRKNFLVRRIVTLTRSYVVGGGIEISSRHRDVDAFARAFWQHPQNRMDRRLGPMCDELTRCGEVFVLLFTNRVDGMSYVRLVPATQIRQVEAGADDYERELRFEQAPLLGVGSRWWLSPLHPDATRRNADGSLPPVMLHFAVNRPVGATRGEGDLGPILPWALRYAKWLEDRVRLNRIRTRQTVLDVQIADDAQVQAKRRELAAQDPLNAGIYVHGPGETMTAHALNIAAGDAQEDGRALRLAVAQGSQTALHYMGEGEGTNYASAKEMGEPTARFYTERQEQLCQFLIDLVQAAYERKVALGLARRPSDYRLSAAVTEVARADNLALAQAARQMVEALATMKVQGWIDDAGAARLAYKFAGETIGEQEIGRILEQSAHEGSSRLMTPVRTERTWHSPVPTGAAHPWQEEQ